MDSTTKGNKLTGSGELGGPRPGEEGIRRVPSPSLSNDRRGEQVDDQACSSAWTTWTREEMIGAGMEELRISDASSGEESVPPKRKTAYKKKRRALSSTTPTESDAEGCTGKETANCVAEARPQSPPPARKANRLPTDEKRLAELRHAPSANLAVNILKVADSIEQMASTAKNLKGTYIRRMRDDAGKARANATELAKRTTASGPLLALEQENLRLRSRLLKAEEEIAELKKARSQPRIDKTAESNQKTTAPRCQIQTSEVICPAPPKVDPGIPTRASQRTLPQEQTTAD